MENYENKFCQDSTARFFTPLDAQIWLEYYEK